MKTISGFLAKFGVSFVKLQNDCYDSTHASTIGP